MGAAGLRLSFARLLLFPCHFCQWMAAAGERPPLLERQREKWYARHPRNCFFVFLFFLFFYAAVSCSSSSGSFTRERLRLLISAAWAICWRFLSSYSESKDSSHSPQVIIGSAIFVLPLVFLLFGMTLPFARQTTGGKFCHPKRARQMKTSGTHCNVRDICRTFFAEPSEYSKPRISVTEI